MRKHFNLAISIFKGLPNNELKRWTKNKHLIFENSSGCTSDGFIQIQTKDPFFTFESNTCYDSISVISYITFKVKGDSISLYKYHETYFDKVNHEQEIAEKLGLQMTLEAYHSKM